MENKNTHAANVTSKDSSKGDVSLIVPLDFWQQTPVERKLQAIETLFGTFQKSEVVHVQFEYGLKSRDTMELDQSLRVETTLTTSAGKAENRLNIKTLLDADKDTPTHLSWVPINHIAITFSIVV